MRSKILVIMTVVASVTNYSEGSPHHHDDPYRQAHRILKEARWQQIRDAYRQQDYYQIQGSSQSNQFAQLQQQLQQIQQQRPASSSGSSGGSSNGGSPPNPILTPGGSSGGSGGGNYGTIGSAIPGGIPQAGGSSSNYPPILPNFPSESQIAGNLGVLPPYPIEQVNRGVSTILNGVRSFDLGQILRGAFVFPRNENVRSVANNVIDSIFGAVKTQNTG